MESTVVSNSRSWKIGCLWSSVSIWPKRNWSDLNLEPEQKQEMRWQGWIVWCRIELNTWTMAGICSNSKSWKESMWPTCSCQSSRKSLVLMDLALEDLNCLTHKQNLLEMWQKKPCIPSNHVWFAAKPYAMVLHLAAIQEVNLINSMAGIFTYLFNHSQRDVRWSEGVINSEHPAVPSSCQICCLWFAILPNPLLSTNSWWVTLGKVKGCTNLPI